MYNIARRVLAMSYSLNSPGVGGGGGEFTLQKLDDGIQPMSTKNDPKNHCAESLCSVHSEFLEEGIVLALVVQSLSSAIHRINHNPTDKCYGNPLRYPLDSDLSGG